jgi:hypothetical protein
MSIKNKKTLLETKTASPILLFTDSCDYTAQIINDFVPIKYINLNMNQLAVKVYTRKPYQQHMEDKHSELNTPPKEPKQRKSKITNKQG